MSDRRALLTDREREIISGEADVSNSYRYQTISRVRNRFGRMEGDLQALSDHGDLLDEFREVVCPDPAGRVSENAGVRQSSGHNPKGGEPKDPAPQPDPPHEASHTTRNGRGEAEHTLRELDLPGHGSKYETRIDTVLLFYDYLREHAGERVSKEDLRDLADENDTDTGYSSFGSLWSNWVKKNKSQGRPQNTLTRLPGVEMDGDDYVYTAEK